MAAPERRSSLAGKAAFYRAGGRGGMQWTSGISALVALQLFMMMIASSNCQDSFSFSSNRWDIVDGAAKCTGSDCRKYACTGKPVSFLAVLPRA
eukprot:2017420-Rhodomonas_salina.2